MHIRKTLIESFWDLPEDAQHGLARFLVGAKLGDIVETRTHQGIDIEIQYLRHGRFHKIGWDLALGCLCSATEAMAVDAMLRGLNLQVQDAVRRMSGQLRHLKLKRDSRDGHPFLHVHLISQERHLISHKLDIVASALTSNMQNPG